MATEAPKTEDPYGGFNEYDHAYDLGVSLINKFDVNWSTFRMFMKMRNLCVQWHVLRIVVDL